MQIPKEEKTYVMIKPDGVRKGLIGEIIRRMEQRDLKIVALEMFQPSREQMDKHYPKDEKWLRRIGERTQATYTKYDHDIKRDFGTADPLRVGKTVRKWLIDYMSSAPLVKMAVQGVHAVDMVRKIVGDTMPYLADMGTIRGDYSADSAISANIEHRAIFNLIHASETPQEARHEIEHWFGKKNIFKYKRFGIDE
ncbi:MAG: nucleoside-diphosphate kinase [Patescibacteria group bacterium]|nr:nucleoside-diphosphate kinase [Patescibacteria group bacterium]